MNSVSERIDCELELLLKHLKMCRDHGDLRSNNDIVIEWIYNPAGLSLALKEAYCE